MKISLEEVRSNPKQRIKVCFKESLEDSETAEPVAGELSISASAAHAHVTGIIHTLLKLTCHSCLTPFLQPLDLELDENFVYEDYLNKREVTHERELLKEDFVETIPFLGVIDISDIVYQAIVLATPTYCSCGKNCPGAAQNKTALSQKTGDVKSYESIDPRWKNLKTLFAKDDLNKK